MTAAFPGASVPAVGQGGFFTYPWLTYLQQFGAQPGAIVSIVPGASPFAYVANGPGTLVIEGGTVSGITLTRSTTTIAVAAGQIPVVNNDRVVITYSVAPSVSFVPG